MRNYQESVVRQIRKLRSRRRVMETEPIDIDRDLVTAPLLDPTIQLLDPLSRIASEYVYG